MTLDRTHRDDPHGSRRVSAVVPPWLHALVQQDARTAMISVSAVVRGVLARHYEAQGPGQRSEDEHP